MNDVLDNFAPGKTVKVRAKSADGKTKEFECDVRIDTPQEVLYYKHGGILQYVLRQLLSGQGRAGSRDGIEGLERALLFVARRPTWGSRPRLPGSAGKRVGY